MKIEIPTLPGQQTPREKIISYFATRVSREDAEFWYHQAEGIGYSFGTVAFDHAIDEICKGLGLSSIELEVIITGTTTN